ncbi:TonB-dependent receptor [Nitrospira sp. NS4]|uniref:TonB-dependent receptor n=1 Tax=Nitrospira sp. NS4 TaxID=3414498 RepID=UPI003C2EBA32
MGIGILLSMASIADAAESDGQVVIRGAVQNQDLRRVGQAVVEVKDQEGTSVATAVSNDAGEFSVSVPANATYSVSAVQDTYRSEYVVLVLGSDEPKPVALTLSQTREIALEVVSLLAPIQYKASSETYSVSRKDIEVLPRGNNNTVAEVLQTVPGVVYGGLGQTHIRQDHANQQFRIDGVPIPEGVSSTFTDIISPRMWERADITLGGMEAQYGNKSAIVVDITSKSGTKPGFGSLQGYGGSNQEVTPSFEYGGTIGEKFRYYILNSYTSTNRGIEPPTFDRPPFHDQSERNQTYLRGDYQHDNRNSVSWIFLNAVAKYQIPTINNLEANPDVLGLLQAQDPTFLPAPSQAVNQNQKENSQYTHMVWRHDVNAENFFQLAGFLRSSYANFTTDPLNALTYTPDAAEPFSTANQKRKAYSLGTRLDYTWTPDKHHLVKSGFQFQYTDAHNTAQLFDFARDPGTGLPIGPVITQTGSKTNVQVREEVWIQDQWSLNDQWTLNLGLRGDLIQGFYNEGQVSPRIGVAYKFNQANVFHAYYGRLFTPPNVEQIAFGNLNLQGTTAEPDNPTGFNPRAERSHYFEVGSYHALSSWATLELAAYYKRNHFQSDAGQFGSTPMLNFFAFEWGYQMGIDGALKLHITDSLSARGSVAWGRCKGNGLQSGHYLLETKEITDINTPGGVFCDHSQTMTSSAVVAYRFPSNTTLSGQMLYGSGLRTASSDEALTNSSHFPSWTTYNASITHVFELPWDKQKLLVGVDAINLFNYKYFYNQGEGSIGLGVPHTGMQRSFFFRAQWFF